MEPASASSRGPSCSATSLDLDLDQVAAGRDDRSMKERRAALAINALGFSSYYLLLPVVPLVASTYGDTVVAGASTAAFMGATVLTQLAAPQLTLRLGSATLLAAGGLTMAVPTLLYGVTHNVVLFFVLTTVRGAAFGILTSVGSAVVMRCTTEQGRGRQLGVYGLIASLPSIVLPGVGVHLHGDEHDNVTLMVCGLLALAVVPLTTVLRHFPRSPGANVGRGIVAAVRIRRLRTPPLIFLPFTVAYGAVFTFIPLWHPGASWLPLMMFGATFTLGRLLIGSLITMVGIGNMFLLTLVTGVLASGGLAFFGEPLLVVSCALAGAAVGSAATTSLFALTAAAAPEEQAASAAVWNIAFDLGIGVGAGGLAVVADLGQGAVFLVLMGLIATSGLGLRTVRTPVGSARPISELCTADLPPSDVEMA
jgi:predicted MFS family arabinose efflux permease